MELKGLRKSEAEPWRVLEFYSGIGGMRYSLMKAAVNAIVVEAFDINDAANDVYEHNFGHRPYQGNIQSLSAADLDSYKADAWLLSPPCQPYTRQGLQKGSSDPRASSFLRILELISQTQKPPLILFVENVVGFEVSDTHQRMVQMLEENDFVLQEFILSPLHFGIPYSRPRYFCLAKRKPFSFRNAQFNNQLFCCPGPLYGHDDTRTVAGEEVPEYWDKLIQKCQPIEDFLEFKTSISEVDTETDFSARSGHSNERNGSAHNILNQYIVPSSLVERWGSVMGIHMIVKLVMILKYFSFFLLIFLKSLIHFLNIADVVFPDSKRCCCFTKSYYRYLKGTGSLLATVQGRQKGETFSKSKLRLRYFTPREVGSFLMYVLLFLPIGLLSVSSIHLSVCLCLCLSPLF
ncbi:hypothetical protein M9H77_19372 [Catharanthus roseus]|uniref:Uncharacterized protein n=1 Tax=Catharanthus roseus TaxID=4058 RepID=A0ACC0BA69_CATRO|nr:hypothetical protein M9H77_19372 [Catharanthus roseus]